MTEDARDNINMNESDAVWDTGRCELSLKSELKIIFERELPNKGYGKWHAWLNNHVVSTGVGILSRMGERNFRDWMKGKRAAKRGVKGCNLRAFEDFVSGYKSGAKCVLRIPPPLPPKKYPYCSYKSFTLFYPRLQACKFMYI